MSEALLYADNKQAIVQFISNRKIVSKAELLDVFSVTSSTLTRILQELVEIGIIKTAGYGPSNGGRKPILYEINGDFGYVVGIEISRFITTISLFNFRLEPVATTHSQMDSSMRPSVYVDYVKGQLLSFCKDHNIELSAISGVGIGAVGPLDREQGLILNPKLYMADGWHQINIRSLFEQQLGIPALLDNGADCAAIGEQYAFRLEDLEADHLLYVHAGVGLRSSVISEGRLVRGKIDREGAFGQMIVRVGDPSFLPSNAPGALENYASITGIIEQLKMHYRSGRRLSEEVHREQDIHYDFFVKSIYREDPTVLELVKQAAAYLGIGIANMINMFQPSKVILGGALTNLYKPHAQLVEEAAAQFTYLREHNRVQFLRGLLQENAVATGAAYLMRTSIIQQRIK